MKIRKATIEDAKACEIMREKEEKKWSAIDFLSSVRDGHCIFLVAEKDKNISGYVIGFVVPTQGKEAMLHETRVSVEERDKGIGKALVDAFCMEAFKRKVKTIHAEIEPRHLGFYCRKCGFIALQGNNLDILLPCELYVNPQTCPDSFVGSL